MVFTVKTEAIVAGGGLLSPDRRIGLHVIREPSPAEIEAARLRADRPF